MYCILVAGMPASGKSTIAVRISESLGIPMLSKDSIKEVLFDDLGFHSRAEKVQLGTAAMHILYYAAAQMMKAGKPFILENNFEDALDEWENSYGDEAINTIVQEMENCRDDTVVVFAGYPKPMEEFLSRNSGLRSRVPFHINFADYSAEEMTQIAALTAEQRGFSVHPQAVEKIMAICEEARKNTESGNGRFCRNLVENAILSFADRVFGENKVVAEIKYVLFSDDFNFKLNRNDRPTL